MDLSLFIPLMMRMFMAGQGTIGMEILDQLEDADAVVVPVGGGGLISGISFVIKKLNPKCKVYGVQAQGAASMVQAVKDHHLESLEEVHTFADGIAVKSSGQLKLCHGRKICG